MSIISHSCKLNIRPIFVSVLGVIIALALFTMLSNFTHEEKDLYKGVSLTNDCTISINNSFDTFSGDAYKYNTNKIKKGDTITITKVIDNYGLINPVVYFENCNNVVNIYLDDEQLYSYGSYSENASIIGYNRVKVSIGNDCSDKCLKITFKVVDKSAISTLPIIKIMSAKGVDNYYLASNLFHILLGIFLLFLGTMFLSFILYSFGTEKKYRKFLWLSLESLSIGMWVLSCFNILEIYFTNYKINYIIEYESIYLSFIFFILYIYDSLKDELYSKIVKYILFLIIALSFAINLLQLFKISYFSETLTMFHIIAFTSTIISATIQIINYKRIEQNIGFIISEYSIIAFVFGTYNLFRMLHVIDSVYVLNYIPIIFFVFLLINYVNFISELLRDFMTKKEKQSLLDMAYLDPLTGIANRRGFERYINNLSQNLNNYIIFSFDLNNLKKVNDTYGHLAGDELIKSFVKALKLIDNIDFCSRMGGDEFNAFIKGSSHDTADKLIKELDLIVDMLNNENSSEYSLSYAYGYAIYISDKNPDINMLINEADHNMYENKLASKNCSTPLNDSKTIS